MEQKITHEWQQAMTKMSCEYRNLVSRGLWVVGPSDFLSIIEKENDERTHSRILAWLLKPTGRHGFRHLFLTHLLRHCGAAPSQVQPIVHTVDCSYWRKGREADIVVWGEDFTLVIEIKVNADEEPDQCNDLHKNFEGEPGARFLFLTRDGREPATATTPGARDAFKTISWPKVRCMIEGALSDPVSKKGDAVAIVENYVVTLKEQFG